jgi:hypothetical protein
MEDGTYPNINLQQGILDCINSLQIHYEHIDQSHLYKAIEAYAEEDMLQPQIRKLAQSIKDKWQRILQGNIEYDSSGEHNEGFRKLQEKLDTYRRSYLVKSASA